MKIGYFLVKLALLFTLGESATASVGPKLFLSYGGLFDRLCSQANGSKILPSWQAELNARLGEFQIAWDADADNLMGALIKLVGKPSERKEMTVTLTLCSAFPNLSNPFLVDIRQYLKSYQGTDKPRPNFTLIDTIFHEFIHNYVRETLPAKSVLLEKYKSESMVIQNHLHLMALQLLVYRALNRNEMEGYLDALYSVLGAGKEYERAWEIVTKIEGPDAFLNEMKSR